MEYVEVVFVVALADATVVIFASRLRDILSYKRAIQFIVWIKCNPPFFSSDQPSFYCPQIHSNSRYFNINTLSELRIKAGVE
jgi:hypothetical protein